MAGDDKLKTDATRLTPETSESLAPKNADNGDGNHDKAKVETIWTKAFAEIKAMSKEEHRKRFYMFGN